MRILGLGTGIASRVRICRRVNMAGCVRACVVLMALFVGGFVLVAVGRLVGTGLM